MLTWRLSELGSLSQNLIKRPNSFCLFHNNFDLNKKPLGSLDVDNRPPPIVKWEDVHHHA